MTEGEQLVKRAKRAKRLVSVGAIVLVVAAIGATFAVIVNFMQSGDISRIERSACAKDPASETCRRIARESAEARSIRDTCIAFWKVGYPCPRPNSGASLPVVGGGDASQPAHAGQPSSPAPAGDRGGTQDDGDGQPKKPKAHSPPVSPAPEVAPGPAGPPGPSSTADDAPKTPPGLLDPALGVACEKTQALNLCNH